MEYLNTSGIYALYVKEYPETCYVGCSINIHNRFQEHLTKLIYNKHTKYKLQGVYNLYNNLQIKLLEEAPHSLLLSREEFWITELDSYNKGYNLTIGGQNSNCGETHPQAKNSKIEYIAAFNLLLDSNKPIKEIAKITGVGYSVIYAISRGQSHVWLKEFFPERYVKLMGLKGSRCSISHITGKNNIIKSPEGTEHVITNISKFARENNLDKSQLCKMLKQKVPNNYKGWSIVWNT